MSKNFRYTLLGLGVAFLIFLLWFFSSIVVYIIISAVLALVGNPIVEFLGKFRVWKFKIPVAIRALIALVCIYGVFIGFFWIFIPVVAKEANELSNIDADSLIAQIQVPLNKAQALYDKYQVRETNSPGFEQLIEERIKHVLNVSILSDMVSSLAEILGNLFIALFSITFITFFFLQEQGMLTEAIVLLAPGKYDKAFADTLFYWDWRSAYRYTFVGNPRNDDCGTGF
jgi:predicted PurR-regulated permease PerM